MKPLILAVVLVAGVAAAQNFPPKDCACRERRGVATVLKKLNSDVFMVDYFWPYEYRHRPHLGFVKLKRTKPQDMGERVNICLLQKNDKFQVEVNGFPKTVVLNLEDTRACAPK
jgi:hypothetical protein